MRRPGHRRCSPAPQDVPGLAARRAALDLLQSVLDDGRMLDEAPGQGSPAERAEARGLADLTLRRLGQIDELISRFVQRTPKGPGRQILRLMTAELLFAGTAPHAAVDMGVRLAQSARGTARLSGLINAVGRKLATEGPALAAKQDAATLNRAGWLHDSLVKDWGRETADWIAEAHLSPAPHDLTLSASADAEALRDEIGGTILPTGSLRLSDRPQISALPGFTQGAWWVQDAAAALPARLIPTPDGKHVLDLCAAPGGKTLQLAAMGAHVTAVDLSETRLERLAENLARTGLSAELECADLLDWSPDAQVDAILLDAPCSATGTVRRHPDLPHRIDTRRISDLADLQAGLLSRAFEWLRPGGVLVFCTCSLLKCEGEDIAAAFLSATHEVRLLPFDKDELPAEFITDAGTLRTRPDQWPDLGGLDGFFAARFQRVDETE